MFAITGITGNIGGQVAMNLLAAHQPIRAVVRDVLKAEPWVNRGCEAAVADIGDAQALAAAFEGAEGVFVLAEAAKNNPPQTDRRRPGIGLRQLVQRSERLRQRAGFQEHPGQDKQSFPAAGPQGESRRDARLGLVETIKRHQGFGARGVTFEGVGTPGKPFSPPVKADNGLNSTKKNTSAIATVIMAK